MRQVLCALIVFDDFLTLPDNNRKWENKSRHNDAIGNNHLINKAVI